MFNYAQATATYLKRGSLDTDHLVEAMNKKQKQVAEEVTQKNKILLEILDKNSVNLTNEEDSNMAIYILRKAVKNQLEIEFLLKIIEGLEIFSKHQDVKANCSRIILNNIKYRFHQKNECIFKLGDKGGSYFIVLKGAVHCLIPDLKKDITSDQEDDFEQNNPKENPSDTSSYGSYNSNNLKFFKNNNLNSELNQQSNDRNTLKKSHQIIKPSHENPKDTQNTTNSSISTSQPPKKSGMLKRSSTISESRTIALLRESKKRDEDQDFLEQAYPNMKLVKTYTSGGAFGEIAILTKEKRTATMVCAQDTHLMCLSKEGFDQIMGAYREFVFNERVEYLRQFSFFKNVPTPELLSLWHYMKEEKFNTKNIIYTEKDPSCFLFFIRKGEVQLNRIVKEEDNNQQVEQVPQPEEELFNNMNLSKQRKDKKINVGKRFPLVILGANCYFGEEEIFQRQFFRVSQAQCMTESSILIIEKKKLFGFLRYHEQFQKFKDDVRVKQHWKEQQLQKPSYLNYQKEKLKVQETQNQITQISDMNTPSLLQKSNSMIYPPQKRYSVNAGQVGSSSQTNIPIITNEKPTTASQQQNNTLQQSQQQKIVQQLQDSKFEQNNFQRTKSLCYNEINVATTSIQELLKYKQQIEQQQAITQHISSSQKPIQQNNSFENNVQSLQQTNQTNTNEKQSNTNLLLQVRKARLSNGVIVTQQTPQNKVTNTPTNTFFTELMKDFNLPDLNPTVFTDEKQPSQTSVHDTSIQLKSQSKNITIPQSITQSQTMIPSQIKGKQPQLRKSQSFAKIQFIGKLQSGNQVGQSQSTVATSSQIKKKSIDLKLSGSNQFTNSLTNSQTLQSGEYNSNNYFKIRKFISQKDIRGTSSSHQEMTTLLSQNNKNIQQLKLQQLSQNKVNYQTQSHKLVDDNTTTKNDNFIYNNIGESLELLNDNDFKKQKEYMQKVQTQSNNITSSQKVLSIDAALMSIQQKKNEPETINKSQNNIPESYLFSPSGQLVNSAGKQFRFKSYQRINYTLKDFDKNVIQSVKNTIESNSSNMYFDTSKVDLKCQQENIFSDKNKFLSQKVRKQFQLQHWKFQQNSLKNSILNDNNSRM